MPAQALRSVHIDGATPAGGLTFIDGSSYVYGVTIACEVDGQTIHIQDKSNPAKVLIPARALKVQPVAADPLWMINPYIVEWTNGKIMTGGILIVTTGTGGKCSVWIDYQAAPTGSGV